MKTVGCLLGAGVFHHLAHEKHRENFFKFVPLNCFPSVVLSFFFLDAASLLALSFAVIFTGRCDLVFAFEETLDVLTTNLSMGELCLALNERNYILQATIAIELFSC